FWSRRWQNHPVATPRKWFDQSQPQTLQAGVLFCYLNAALSILYLIAFGATLPLILLVAAVGANGIANEKRWGYRVAVVAASIYVVIQLIAFVTFSKSLSSVLNLAFAALLVVLLLHPESRRYQRIWFR
ncbi:MAG TPA: hypothetical protein VN793_04630, partial [Acidimicrobiales bacterium]|nr:hypothetical protein [Acidimicrobiales bacterium]